MSKIKALVVDDSKIMRSQVKRALDQLMIAEFEYEEAMDGEDALEKFNDDIDILFVDWNMPKMTGVEFSRAIRDKGYDKIPIIMVTAEKSMGKVDKALNEGGANEYITKPFTADKMSKAISRYFDDNGQIATGGEEEGDEKKSFFSSILKS
ncbi:response regulator [Gracilimonas mengyeensis]|uniref:Two-component system, chemotaxis family, response regulator CheY n=1 Tax=Gracilimonas mengyeensis TaxID=1302730 RepID=A0A521D742_9BACT|nr:response regulator [Gracilimonas mengyeensis]SMO67526.1 two-component system, chemotaxis family, response regulator CheY [Gracilimonas mengyeensis]